MKKLLKAGVFAVVLALPVAGVVYVYQAPLIGGGVVFRSTVAYENEPEGAIEMVTGFDLLAECEAYGKAKVANRRFKPYVVKYTCTATTEDLL